MNLRGFVSELHRREPVLSLLGWVQWMLAAAFLLAMPFDSREILGLNPWIKPLKFAVSIALYSWTLGWFLGYLRDAPRLVKTVRWGVFTAMMVEIFLISLQSLRGVPSHFNRHTPLDYAIFGTMGTFIVFNSVLLGAVFVRFMRHAPRELPPGYLWGIRLGILFVLLASLEAGAMLAHGAHAVGVPDGGPGLPIVNWSTEAGDFRIAHFLGLHGMQLLPLAGYWFSRHTPEKQLGYTLTAGLIYLALMALAFGLAINGVPLLHFS